MNNLLILVGRITKELELRYTPNNKAVLDLPIAVNNGKDDTTFITVTVFGTVAETTYKYCHKGDTVGVQAIVKNHNWEDKDGKKRYDYSFIANKITFLSTKKQEESKEEVKETPKEETDPFANAFEEFGEQVAMDISDNFLD